MNLVWRVLKNSGALTLAVLLEQAVNWFVPWYVARIQGREDWGYYSTAMAFIVIAAPLAYWGLDQLLPREVARNRPQAGRLLANAAIAGGVVSALVTGLSAGLVYFLEYPPAVQELILIGLALTLLPRTEAMLCEAVVNGLERMEWIVLVRFPISLLRVGASIFLLSQGLGLYVLFVFWAVYYGLASIGYVLLLKRSTPDFSLEIDGRLVRQLAVQAFPFVATIFIGETAKHIDRILLSQFQDTDTVGLYTTGILLVQTMYLFAPAIMSALFPELSRTHVASKQRFSTLVTGLFRILLVGSFPVTLTMIVFAGELILFIFGQEYAASIPVMQIYALGIVPSFLARLLYRTLLASNNERLTVRVSLVNSIAGFALTLLLIPRYGLLGAAFAAMTMEFFGLGQNLFYVSRRVFRFEFGRAMLLPGTCALASTALYLLVRTWNPYVAWACAMAAFVIMVFATGVIRREELSMVLPGKLRR